MELILEKAEEDLLERKRKQIEKRQSEMDDFMNNEVDLKRVYVQTKNFLNCPQVRFFIVSKNSPKMIKYLDNGEICSTEAEFNCSKAELSMNHYKNDGIGGGATGKEKGNHICSLGGGSVPCPSKIFDNKGTMGFFEEGFKGKVKEFVHGRDVVTIKECVDLQNSLNKEMEIWLWPSPVMSAAEKAMKRTEFVQEF